MSDETGDGSDAQLGEMGRMAAWIDDVVLRSVSGDRVVGRRRCQPGAVVRFDRIGPEESAAVPLSQTSRVVAFAPEITRQRLLVEGYFTTDVDEGRVEGYLHGVAAHLDLRAYGQPAIFAPGGSGREENQGFDAFLPLIDSGISLYVWSVPRFISALLFTCKAFDEHEAITYTRDYFGLGTFDAHPF